MYDRAGRVVASRQSSAAAVPWTCATFDGRGRPASLVVPAFDGQPARTVTSNYAVGNNPLVTSVTDAAGTIETTMDLLGRVVTYTDVWGTVTTTSYDQVGRPFQSVTKPATTVATTVLSTFDAAGRLATQKIDGVTVATPAYSAATGETVSVAYGNGTSLSRMARDGSGATAGLTWALNGTSVANDVVRSQAGSVLTSVTAEGSTTVGTDTYTYDAVGRLTQAVIPHHTLTYGFGEAESTCGAWNTPGRNTNRTRMTDQFDGGTEALTTYCYDQADRLTSSAGGLAVTPIYDVQGNTKTLARKP